MESYKVIGFANKYYTLWEVVIENDYIIYGYLKNLSYDFDEAKLKAGTDKFDENLRGKSKTFTKIIYNNGSEQLFENTSILKFIDSKMTFGKYKGKKIIDIVNEDPGYLAWVVMNVPNVKLNTVLQTLEPIQKILNSNIDHTKKETKKNEFINNIINKFNKIYNISLKWKKPMNGKMSSENFKTKAILKTPFIKNYSKNKGTKQIELDIINDNRITPKYKRNIINDNSIVVLFKKDPLFFLQSVAKINNYDITKFAKPQYRNNGEIAYYNDLVIPDELKNREYELQGYFEIIIDAGILVGFFRKEIKFICTKLTLL